MPQTKQLQKPAPASMLCMTLSVTATLPVQPSGLLLMSTLVPGRTIPKVTLELMALQVGTALPARTKWLIPTPIWGIKRPIDRKIITVICGMTTSERKNCGELAATAFGQVHTVRVWERESSSFMCTISLLSAEATKRIRASPRLERNCHEAMVSPSFIPGLSPSLRCNRCDLLFCSHINSRVLNCAFRW